MTYIKDALYEILTTLTLEQNQNAVVPGNKPSDKLVKICWLLDIISYMQFSINSLNEITLTFNELREKNYNSSGEFLQKKFKEVIYHSRNFFEIVFILFEVLDNVYKFDKDTIFSRFTEIKYVNNLRNIFIVHPDELGISFAASIPVVLQKGEVLMFKIGNSSYSDDESRKYYFTKLYSNQPEDISKKYLTDVNGVRSAILELKNTRNFLQESKVIESVKLHGAPSFNQNKFSLEIKEVLELIL